MPSNPTDWIRALPQLATDLIPIVRQFKLDGAPTRVLYRSPSQSVELPAYPIASRSQAVDAALLACTDTLPYAPSAVTRAVAVASDASTAHPQTHVLFAADREDVIQAIADLISDAGLCFQSAVPLDALTLRGLVSEVIHEKRFTSTLCIGEHSSFFLAGGAASVAFCRMMAIGVDTLAASLTHPLRAAPGADPIELTHTTARQILHEHGIPELDAIICESPRLTGASAMAVLQPVLQRFVVELRQSIRFGLSEQQRQTAALTLRGPGSTLRNLANIIGRELGVKVTVDESKSQFNHDVPASAGSELALIVSHRATLAKFNLQPPQLVEAENVRRRRNWLIIGAAAALGFVAFDYFNVSAQLKEAHRQADSLALHAAGHEQLQLTANKLLAAINAAKSLQLHIDSELGSQSDYRAILHEISRLAPENIRFTELTINRLPSGTEGRLAGYVLLGPAAGSHADLENFIDTLRSSALFDRVTLGNIQASQLVDRDGQSFQATFTASAIADAGHSTAVVAVKEQELTP